MFIIIILVFSISFVCDVIDVFIINVDYIWLVSIYWQIVCVIDVDYFWLMFIQVRIIFVIVDVVFMFILIIFILQGFSLYRSSGAG